jgi:hypothetical protein
MLQARRNGAFAHRRDRHCRRPAGMPLTGAADAFGTGTTVFSVTRIVGGAGWRALASDISEPGRSASWIETTGDNDARCFAPTPNAVKPTITKLAIPMMAIRIAFSLTNQSPSKGIAIGRGVNGNSKRCSKSPARRIRRTISHIPDRHGVISDANIHLSVLYPGGQSILWRKTETGYLLR